MEHKHIYVDGAWIAAGGSPFDVVDPATERTIATVVSARPADVDLAVAAAAEAATSFRTTTPAERRALLEGILRGYRERSDELAAAVTAEMGAPVSLAVRSQVPLGIAHLENAIAALDAFDFEQPGEPTTLIFDPVGVVAMITPWNWPLHQIMSKVAYALAAGATMVLKPSEIAPLDALILADIIHDAGVPAGVFNLVTGSGAEVGAQLSSHRSIDMVSFTGSTRAGVLIAQAAAPTVKRVAQELGGKAANIILDGDGFATAVETGVRGCSNNAGQSCAAPTRMLVPVNRLAEAERIAASVTADLVVGDPLNPETFLGPLANAAQFDRVQGYIERGISDGAKLVAGGTGRPNGLTIGYYARPTVFSEVDPDSVIAQEEIFGPVLSLIPYADEEDAIRIANNTDYGLVSYISGGNKDVARSLARRIVSGQVRIDYAADQSAPFGGRKQSGNGREMGHHGLLEYLEPKAVIG